MDFGLKSNLNNVVGILFKQITELGSITILLLMAMFSAFFDMDLSIRLIIGLISVTFISFIIKALFFKERPKKQKTNTFIERIDASSFPSVHSARITVLIFWLFLVTTSFLLRILLILVGITVAYSRIYLKKHFFGDVIGGIIIGGVVNVLMYLFM